MPPGQRSRNSADGWTIGHAWKFSAAEGMTLAGTQPILFRADRSAGRHRISPTPLDSKILRNEANFGVGNLATGGFVTFERL